ncbi:MAG: acetyl-CoA carboxylase biotin carboxyl carrier protein subunit [Catalinimonas sp.]
MYQISVDKRVPHTWRREGGADTLDGTPVVADTHQEGGRHFHVLLGARSYRAELLHFDPTTKTACWRINGRTYEAKAQDTLDQLLDKMGLKAAAGAQLSDVKAPMPGMILRVAVQAGQTVEKGDALLVLEAMKMENLIKAPGAGTVSEVLIEQGATVNKSQVLIRFA